MKLAVEMAVMEMDGEWSAVAVGEDSSRFHGMLKLNETAAEIIKLLTEETTHEAVLKAMTKKYPDTPVADIRNAVADLLNQLLREGLLIDND